MVPTLVRDAIRAAAGARRTHHDRAAVAISSPQPRRRVTLPRNVAGGRRPEPYSRADAPFFRSPGFFVRIGGLAIIVGVALCVLVLRAWSIQVLHGPQYTSLANGQAYRTVDLAGPRGAIVDSKRRKLADTTGHVVIAADVAAIGNIDKTGWHASADGLASLRQLSKLAHVPVHTLIVRIKRSVVRSPFAPATVLPHPVAGLIDYLDERSSDYPGFKTTTVVSRSYPQGSFGSEFLGLLGEVSDSLLASPRYAHAKPGETVGVSGIEAAYDRILNGGFRRAHLRVDSRGRVVGPLEYSPSGKALPTLQLTIDARLQRAAEKAIKNGVALARANGHAVHAPALQRLVHDRGLHLPQCRGRRLQQHVAPDCARGVVRHLVLPARRQVLLPPQPGHPDVGAPSRSRPSHRSRRARRVARARADACLAEEDVPRVVVRGPDDQPLDRPGLPRRDPIAARGRLLGARERRDRRAPSRRERHRARRVGADAQVSAGEEGQARRPVGHPRRPLRGRALAGRHVVVDLRELHDPGRGQDGYRRGRHRPQRSFVVRVVGAGVEPEGRRRRPRRARRIRGAGRRTRRTRHLSGVLQPEALAPVGAGRTGWFARITSCDPKP